MIPPDEDAAFVAAMEQVLEVYQRPEDPAFPVVAMDERPVVLHRDLRSPIPHGTIDQEAVAIRRLFIHELVHVWQYKKKLLTA